MQKRLHNYKDPIESFPFNNRMLGILNSGRYCGFDTMLNVIGLGCEISHSATGKLIALSDNISFSPKTGVYMTPMGVIISEDDVLPFTFDTNLGNPYNRYDFIVAEHEWLPSQFGQAATYSVLKGPGTGAYPVLPNPNKQTILGVMKLPPGVTDLTSATYTASQVPWLGAMTILDLLDQGSGNFARLDLTNEWTGQRFSHYALPANVTGAKWQLPGFPANSWHYGPAAPAGLISEISATKANAELIISNLSTNTLSIQLGATPGSGGLPIWGEGVYGGGDIILPQFGWAVFRQIGTTYYALVADSVSRKILQDELTIIDQDVYDIINPEAWKTLYNSGGSGNTVLENGAVVDPNPYMAPGYRKTRLGAVEMRGKIDLGTIAGSTPQGMWKLFTFPLGYYPNNRVPVLSVSLHSVSVSPLLTHCIPGMVKINTHTYGGGGGGTMSADGYFHLMDTWTDFPGGLGTPINLGIGLDGIRFYV